MTRGEAQRGSLRERTVQATTPVHLSASSDASYPAPGMAELCIERRIDAPRSLLWSYISTATGLSCWQADHVEGDLESGSFSLRWPQLGARMDLSVTEIEHERRILLRAGDHRLSMNLEDSKIVMHHGGLHEEDDLVGLESSWNTALSLLQIAATTHPRVPRKVHWLFQPIAASAELAHYYFTERHGLRQWLGETERPVRSPGGFSLDCDGTKLSGTVLCAERDVCLKVNELGDGALTFRTLPAPEDGRVVAIGVSSWTQTPSKSLLRLLEAALVRFARLTEGVRG